MSTLPALNPNVSHIVVFPYSSNIELDPSGEPAPMLSVLSRMSIDSAVALWEENPSTRLVIAGETCYPGEFPDTTDLMIERAKEVARVPDDALAGLHTLEDGTPLNTTHLQAEAVRRYFGKKPMRQARHALTLALGYHMARVEQACDVRAINTDYMGAEHILELAGRMDEYRDYEPGFKELARSERALRLMNRFDSKGGIGNRIAGRAGARMMDFSKEMVKNEKTLEDELVVTVRNTTSAKRFREVTGSPLGAYDAALAHRFSE